MNLRKQLLTGLAATLIGLGSGVARADVWEYDFGANVGGSGPASANFGHLTVSSSDLMSFTYNLSLNGSFNSFFGTNSFVTGMLVNTDSNNVPNSVSIDSGSWGVAQVRWDDVSGSYPGGEWEFSLGFCGTGVSCNSALANARLAQGESVQWTVDFGLMQDPPFGDPGLQLSVVTGDGLGFYQPDVFQVDPTPTPEPGPVGMLLAGLGLLGWTARRKRQA